jgi:hypothetical protein
MSESSAECGFQGETTSFLSPSPFIFYSLTNKPPFNQRVIIYQGSELFPWSFWVKTLKKVGRFLEGFEVLSI